MNHLLFVCTSGKRASVAAAIFEDSDNCEARAAGFNPINSSMNLTGEKVKWAGTIFVFDEKNEFHKMQLLRKFPDAEEKEIVVLGVPGGMGEELESVIRGKLKEKGINL
jgi:predicted protein tyrosine phosphatase